MSLLKRINIRNFKGIRETQSISLAQGTYIVGKNNSGKTTVLEAFKFFFDDKAPIDSSFLNRSEFLAKQAGYNRSEISVVFNANEISSKAMQKRIIKRYKNEFEVNKICTYRERTDVSVITYSVNNGKEYSIEDLNSDINKLINSVNVTYLHPQDGEELLKRAQEKLKSRLILNWGRRGAVTDTLEDLKKGWGELRRTSNSYLSRSLSSKLQDVWPGCEVKVNLPSQIEHIIRISDIGIKNSKKFPEIPLTSQGTGAQSMVLYLAHYLLDSDRSLHRGEYHPLWLLEEPESFLHGEMIFTLGKQLASKEWLENIQMITSTHSPIILACSNESEKNVKWVTLDQCAMTMNKPLEEMNTEDIENIGQQMGDVNFEAYFTYAEESKYFLFIEDSREETIKSLENSGIHVNKGLGGTGEINKYIDTFKTISSTIKQAAFFLIDHDLGKKDFKRYIKTRKRVQKKEGLEKYKISPRLYLVLLPKGFTYENLYSEYDNHLEEMTGLLFDEEEGKLVLSETIPAKLSRTHSKIRDKGAPKSWSAAKKRVKNTKDVKDIFWEKVKREHLEISNKYKTAIKELIEE